MLLPRFELHTPASVAEASALLAEFEGDVALYAGGTELLTLMKLGLAFPAHLVACRHLDELQGIEVAADSVVVGAAITHRRVETDPELGEAIPALGAMTATIANVRVRNSGTIGGNLCFAEPNSDPSTLLLALGCQVKLRSAGGSRSLELRSFLHGAFETALDPDELMTGLQIRRPGRDERVAFRRIAFHKERPLLNVAIVHSADTSRVVAGGLTSTPVEVPGVHELIAEGTDEAAGLVADEVRAEVLRRRGGDVSDYMAHLLTVTTRRVIVEDVYP